MKQQKNSTMFILTHPSDPHETPISMSSNNMTFLGKMGKIDYTKLFKSFICPKWVNLELSLIKSITLHDPSTDPHDTHQKNHVGQCVTCLNSCHTTTVQRTTSTALRKNKIVRCAPCCMWVNAAPLFSQVGHLELHLVKLNKKHTKQTKTTSFYTSFNEILT